MSKEYSNNWYKTELTFKKAKFILKIKPHEDDGFDIDIKTNKPLSGNDFQALKKYLIDEGYVDLAKEFCGIKNDY